MNKAQFLNAVMELAESVANFHERFRTEEDAEGFRDLGLLTEELGEVARAVNKGDRVGALNELSDLAYVTLGALYLAGDYGGSALLGVAGKNNSKSGLTHYRHPETGKITKRV